MDRRRVAIIFCLIEMVAAPDGTYEDSKEVMTDELWAHVELLTGATTAEAQALAKEAYDFDWEEAG